MFVGNLGISNIKWIQVVCSPIVRVERWDSPVSWDHEGFDVHVDQVQNEEEPQTLSLSSEEKCEGEVIWSVSLLFFAMLILDSHAWTSLEVLIYLSLKQDGWFFLVPWHNQRLSFFKKAFTFQRSLTCLKKHTHRFLTFLKVRTFHRTRVSSSHLISGTRWVSWWPVWQELALIIPPRNFIQAKFTESLLPLLKQNFGITKINCCMVKDIDFFDSMDGNIIWKQTKTDDPVQWGIYQNPCLCIIVKGIFCWQVKLGMWGAARSERADWGWTVGMLFLKTNMKLKLRSLVFCRCVFFLKGIFVGTLLLVF